MGQQSKSLDKALDNVYMALSLDKALDNAYMALDEIRADLRAFARYPGVETIRDKLGKIMEQDIAPMLDDA